jgi:signal transduction histidine kinase
MSPAIPADIIYTFAQTANRIQSDSAVFLILVAGSALLGLLLGGLLGYLAFVLSERRRQSSNQLETENVENELSRQGGKTRFQDIYNLISSINASLNYNRILENVLDTSAAILEEPGSSSDQLVRAVFLFKDNPHGPAELYVGSARRFTNADMRIVLPGSNGVLGDLLNTGEACLSGSLHTDPELCRIVALRSCNAVCCIPLKAALDIYGILLFAHPQEDYFTAERRDILEMFSVQASIAIQNARLYHELELEKERMLEIQEEARNKLARDLHDGPTQSVAAIAMRVNFARRMIERDGVSAAEELFKVEELARSTAREIRHMLFTLRPLILESQGLIPALEAMAEKSLDTYSQNVIIQADPDFIPDLEMSKQAVIFYIVEEAVNNARKHAQSAHVWVRLKPYEKEMALLEIEDDGVGFNIGSVDAFYEKRGSLGMVNMRERAELVNGIFRIDSNEGRGTSIQVVIPLTEEATSRLRSRL